MTELKALLLAFDVLTHHDSKKWYDDKWKLANRGAVIDERSQKVKFEHRLSSGH